MHCFEHEFGEINQWKSTVKGDRITWKVEGRGEKSKRKMSCYKTFELVDQRGFECDFRLFTTLLWIELPCRNLGLDSVFLVKISGKETLIVKEKLEFIQKGRTILEEERCTVYNGRSPAGGQTWILVPTLSLANSVVADLPGL